MKIVVSTLLILLSATTFAQNNCPTYSAPLCATDEKVILNKNSSGCDAPVCAKKNSTSCPVYSKPLCTNGEVVLLEYRDGCSSPVCSHMKGLILPLDVEDPNLKDSSHQLPPFARLRASEQNELDKALSKYLGFRCDANNKNEFFVAQNGNRSGLTKVRFITGTDYIKEVKEIDVDEAELPRSEVLQGLDSFGQFTKTYEFDKNGKAVRSIEFARKNIVTENDSKTIKLGKGTIKDFDANLVVLRSCCLDDECRTKHLSETTETPAKNGLKKATSH